MFRLWEPLLEFAAAHDWGDTDMLTEESSTRIIGTRPIDEHRGSLAFVSAASLRRIYAQEILSSFLWAIVGTVHLIHDDSQHRSAINLGDHEGTLDQLPDPKLENSFLQQKLAEIITDSGVTSSIQDAYALIIPPFATADKLPSRPSNGLAQGEVEPIPPNPAHE
ncbi:hypothetical protein HOY82DRAFT_667776 [Tuber indicum]|nr:hypothetical protein HOY82DRAFT_667776 [Tuber indicum]